MNYRNLGNSGVKVSVVGIGTNRFGNEKVVQSEVNSIIDAAIDLGINHLDTSDSYQNGNSEITLGIALKNKWDKFFLATKFFNPTGTGPNDRGNSRYHIMNAVNDSLRRLQHDHIDLYYVHRWDESSPIEETLNTLNDLVHQGKVRYIGASNFAAWQIARSNLLAQMNNWEPFVALQSHYHLLEHEVETEVLPFCRAANVGFIPYFPLAGGFLTGKYKFNQPIPAGSRGESNEYVQQYMTEKNYQIVERLSAWAKDHGHEMNELAIAWLTAQTQVSSVISGATSAAHVVANAKAAEWVLTGQQLLEIETLLPKR
jgi:aryl-alcohol dehydrogenase-like predicted oxidoreductase